MIVRSRPFWPVAAIAFAFAFAVPASADDMTRTAGRKTPA